MTLIVVLVACRLDLVMGSHFIRDAVLLPENQEMTAMVTGVSIGDLNMQLAFLWEEIQGYKQVMNVLNNARFIQAASDAVMTGYEKPGDQSEAAKQVRWADESWN